MLSAQLVETKLRDITMPVCLCVLVIRFSILTPSDWISYCQ